MTRNTIFKLRCFAALLALASLACAQDKTFFVRDGAFPWYDRVDRWELTDVPPSLQGTGPLPQTNCTSRVLDVPKSTSAVTIGVAKIDLAKFQAKYPTARETGEAIAVKSPQDTRVDYRVLSFPNPPAQIGKFSAGLLLLKLGTSKSVPNAPDANAPQPTNDAATSGAGAPTTGVNCWMQLRPTEPHPTELRPMRIRLQWRRCQRKAASIYIC